MKTYHEIEKIAFDLYAASSSNKSEWIEEYNNYLNGAKDTVWNEKGFSNWSDSEKEECYKIIINLYK